MYLQNNEVVDNDEIPLINAIKNAKTALYKVISYFYLARKHGYDMATVQTTK